MNHEMKHPIILKHFKKAEEEISPDRLCSRGFAAPPPTSDFQPDIRGIKVVKQQNHAWEFLGEAIPSFFSFIDKKIYS